MTLRLSEAEAAALRARAKREDRSMQDVARQAVRGYVENHSRLTLSNDLIIEVATDELDEVATIADRLRRGSEARRR